MIINFIKSEIKSSKLITFVFILFITLNILLTSLAGIIAFTLFSSIDFQMDLAKTPHYLQMHQGEINKDRLVDFSKSNQHVKDYQLLEFLNLDNSQVSIGAISLQDSLQDNGLTTQGETFDFLLNLENQVIQVKEGEVYLPLMFLNNGGIKVGDVMKIGDYPLIVAGFLRDSQMNSPLSSSKRFLVHQDDFSKLRDQGKMEYLIEFRLVSTDNINAFEQDYNLANLESNGPTITYPLFKMINAITEGIVIATLLLASIVILLISFLCIKFTLLEKMEATYEEIAIMKAIGINDKRIKRLYLGLYYFICLSGSVLGILSSLLIASVFLNQIKMNTGISLAFMPKLIISLLVASFISFIILIYVNKTLDKLKEVSVVKALSGQRQAGKEFSLPAPKRTSLIKGKKSRDDFKIALKGILSTKSFNRSMSGILILTIFLMIVPINMYLTIKDQSFIRYMGMGVANILIEQKNIEQDSKVFVDFLEENEDIESFALYNSKSYKVQIEDGTKLDMKMDYGDHGKFVPMYLEGSYPSRVNEAAISYLYAEELNLEVGDQLRLVDEEKDLIISGIYSDITDGGKTGKILFNDNKPSASHSFLIKVKEGVDANQMINKLTEVDSLAKVSNISTYFDQFFGGVIHKMKIAALISIVVAIFIASFISLLFMKIIITQEEYDIAIMKSIGFKEKKIKRQYLIRFAIVFLPAIILGIILTKLLGEPLVSLLFSSFGITKLKFVSKVFIVYLVFPLVLAVSIYGSIQSVLNSIKDIKLVKYLRG